MNEPKKLLLYKSLLAGLSEYESLQACSLLFAAKQGQLFARNLQTGDFHKVILVSEDEADAVDRELGGLRFEKAK